MSRLHRPKTSGQGVVEYLLLIGLLAVAAVSVWIIAGPGIGAIYQKLTSGSRPSPPVEGVPTSDAATSSCPMVAIVGDARLLAVDGRQMLALGGRSDCSLVIGASAGGSDPLVADPIAKPARFHCAALDDATFSNDLATDVERTFFQLNSQPIALRVNEMGTADMAPLFEASLQFNHLIVEKQALLIRGETVDIHIDNRIGSPMLAALEGAGSASIQLLIYPRLSSASAAGPGLIQDRASLRDMHGLFRLEMTVPCQ